MDEVWLEGDALEVAFKLGLRPKVGDEVRLTTRADTSTFTLISSSRGSCVRVLRVDLDRTNPAYYTSPEGSGWVHLEHIVALKQNYK